MFRVIKESENVDERQHCFLVQTAGQESRYFSMETRQDLLKVESAWHRAVCQTVSQMGVSDKFSCNVSICWIYVNITLTPQITKINPILCIRSQLMTENSEFVTINTRRKRTLNETVTGGIVYYSCLFSYDVQTF